MRPSKPRPTPPFPLPTAYEKALAEHGGRELELDWTVLARKCPPMWPGTLTLFRAADVQRQNKELQARWRGGQWAQMAGTAIWFIGTNSAGIVFALDASGRVSIFDEIEMEAEPLARSFDKLLAAAHLEAKAEKKPEKKAAPDLYARKAPGVWAAIEARLKDRRAEDSIDSDLYDLRNWARSGGHFDAFDERLKTLRNVASASLKKRIDGYASWLSPRPTDLQAWLPAEYPEVVIRCHPSSVQIDWRTLFDAKPAGFSGKICFLGFGEQQELDQHYKKRVPAARRKALYSIANDTAGKTIALDRAGPVVIVDEQGREQQLAPDFRTLARAIGFREPPAAPAAGRKRAIA